MAINDIKETLNKRFLRPLEDFYKRRIIIWNDYEQEFLSEINELVLDNAEVVVLSDNNNFMLKKLILIDKPLTNFVIYNPMTFENEEQNWLIDIFEYSEHFKADYLSGLIDELHATDSIMIRNVLKKYSKFFENKVRKQKFIELTNKIEDVRSIHLGVLGVLTNVKRLNISEFLLSIFKEGYDSENKIYKAIESFGDITVFKELVFKVTGYNGNSLEELLYSIIITALSQTLTIDNISHTYDKYFNKEFITNCYNIVDEWFNYDAAYAHTLLTKVGRNLNIVDMLDKLTITQLISSDIFPHINGVILTKVFKEICNNIIKTKENIDLINKRRTMKFYDEYKNYYEGIYYISLMQEMYIKYQNSFHMVKPLEIWKLYEEELYKFDTYYRKLHYYFNLSFKQINVYIDDSFKECVDYIENLYKNWYLTNLTFNWNNASMEELSLKGKIQGITNQIDFYKNYVEKEMEEKITFVIISDALRYEVGKELFNKLTKKERSKVSINSMQGVFPSITKFGMSALLPGKKELDYNCDIFINDKLTEGIINRDIILKSNNPASVAVTYDGFIKSKKEERAELIKGKKLVYIYHDEIDARGHVSEEQIFAACEDTIADIANLVTIINNLRSSSRIVITSDHGFLYNYKPLDETSKISKNDIDGIIQNGRRYLIGKDNTRSDLLMPIKLLINTRDEKYCGFASKEVVRIKVSGSNENYVHGGISLEELMIPVIVYENVRVDSKEYDNNKEKYNNKKVKIQLLGENRKISNLTFPLSFYQNDKVSNNLLESTYEIFMQDKQGKIISDIKTIIANKQDEDSSLRTFKILLTLKNQQYLNTDVYYLMIIEKDTREVIERIEYQISLMFDSDFGL